MGTPHYGEACKLLGESFNDRFLAIRDIQGKYGGNWVLKGPGTLIMKKNIYYVNNFSNSILATSGTEDVLSGLIGGLLAQKQNDSRNQGIRYIRMLQNCWHCKEEKQLLPVIY